MDTRLFVTIDIRAFGRFPLVHEPSPSTLSCSACMLFVCLVCLHVLCKAYFVVIPSKPLDRVSLVKNGLIVNKTIVVLLLVL